MSTRKTPTVASLIAQTGINPAGVLVEIKAGPWRVPYDDYDNRHCPNERPTLAWLHVGKETKIQSRETAAPSGYFCGGESGVVEITGARAIVAVRGGPREPGVSRVIVDPAGLYNTEAKPEERVLFPSGNYRVTPAKPSITTDSFAGTPAGLATKRELAMLLLSATGQLPPGCDAAGLAYAAAYCGGYSKLDHQHLVNEWLAAYALDAAERGSDYLFNPQWIEDGRSFLRRVQPTVSAPQST